MLLRYKNALALALFSVGTLWVAASGFAASPAEGYPASIIKLTVPYPPGALTDLLARTLGERLRVILGQPIIIENKPGAGTLVGAEYVKNQPADGHNLLMATSTTLGI